VHDALVLELKCLVATAYSLLGIEVLDLGGVDLVMLHFFYAFGSIFSTFEFHQYDTLWVICYGYNNIDN
jgi:hypothetical protein